MDEADKLLSQQLYSWLPLLLQQTTPTSLVGLSGWLHHKSDIAEILPPSLSLSPRPFPLPSLHVPSSAVCASDLLAAHQHVQKLLLSATMTQDPEALAMLQLHRYHMCTSTYWYIHVYFYIIIVIIYLLGHVHYWLTDRSCSQWPFLVLDITT